MTMQGLRRILIIAFPAVFLPAVFFYDVINSAVDLEISGLTSVREGAIVLCFFLLSLVLEGRRARFRKGTTREIGRFLIISFAALSAVGLISFLQAFATRNEDRIPEAPSALMIFYSLVIAVVLGLYAIDTLQTIRDLVMFKRRKGTRRNYVLYLVALFAACASVLPILPAEASIIASIFFPIAVLLGVVNSFKQNWIVYLSRREKIYSIIYSALLFVALVVLNVLLAQNTPGNRSLSSFSHPLHMFVQVNSIFGAIYFGMAFVSTLFHLPTAEVFERKQSELNSLHNLSRLVTQVFDFNDLVNTVTQMTMEVCGARGSWLELVQIDGPGSEMKVDVVSKKNVSDDEIQSLDTLDRQSLRSLLVESQKVLLIDDVWNDKRTRYLKELDMLRGSLLSVPLVAHGQLIGILHATKELENGFDQDDIDVMTTFADHVTIAIENSKLIARSLERERLQQELMVAKRMQKRLLPQGAPEIPSVDFSAISESSTEVGGDYYDFILLPNDQLGIVVGDVSGKGVSAAFYMAEVKGIFLSLSKICKSPRELLVRANHTLMENLEKNAFVSLVYAILDVRKARLTLARAGHCPVVYVSGSKHELVRPTGLGLGLTDGAVFEDSTEERTIMLRRNDVCVFYTDGITESRNADEEEFGYDRLVATVLEARNLPAIEIKNRILEAVRTFTGNQSYTDDMTLVVIKWLGSPHELPQESPMSIPMLRSEGEQP
ncbi:MAG: GAF domain-containing SpoIIE family protein phosphatase [Bacteroidota bacterium]